MKKSYVAGCLIGRQDGRGSASSMVGFIQILLWVVAESGLSRGGCHAEKSSMTAFYVLSSREVARRVYGGLIHVILGTVNVTS